MLDVSYYKGYRRGAEVNGLLEVANIWPLEVGQFSRIRGINRKFAPKNEKSSP